MYDTKSRNILRFTIALLFVQLIYGGFMAGLKAAQVAPTWPDINGKIMPTGVLNSFYNLFHDPLAIHFIHRGIAYLLTVVIIAFFMVTGKKQRFSLYNKFRVTFLMLVILQVLLGIFTVINATSGKTFIWLGVLHQFSAMLLVMCSLSLFFMTRKVKLVSAS
jgi:cytochrome c oxidase assembly protein subunit 15